MKRSLRGRTGHSRALNDAIFKPGKGRRGWGAYNAAGKLLATQTNRKALVDWYGKECTIARLSDETEASK